MVPGMAAKPARRFLSALKTVSVASQETACPTDFLSIRVYLGDETTRRWVWRTDLSRLTL